MASVYHLKCQSSINEAKNKVDILSTHSNRKKKPVLPVRNNYKERI